MTTKCTLLNFSLLNYLSIDCSMKLPEVHLLVKVETWNDTGETETKKTRHKVNSQGERTIEDNHKIFSLSAKKIGKRTNT